MNIKHAYDEQLYPITFRAEEAKLLGNHLASRDSVELIGMKRIGISNFLRFFLNHKAIVKNYIDPSQKHLFITVDLNDLIEMEILPFWRLMLKRIVDTVNAHPEFETLKKQVNDQFLKSIQISDLFFTVDTVRQTLKEIVAAGYMPILFFIRFDRLQEVVTPELFSNLQGIVEATGQQLAYVFTSYRDLYELSPKVFHKPALAAFSHKIYLKPAKIEDMRIIMETLLKKYNLTLDEDVKEEILNNCGGHVQYVQLSLIIVNEMLKKSKKLPSDFIKIIAEEERMSLQSEELYGTLKPEEQQALLKIYNQESLNAEEEKHAAYLWNTGYIKSNGSHHVFSPFFASYLQNMERYHSKSKVSVGLTKKEQMLYDVLKNHMDEICEREDIIQAVWPECNEIGVSDWALDRLVSRLRGKMKLQEESAEIQTIKTRGFKLVSHA
jgi:DNA-binding winged helix-turn-helix (wHTH) protein